MTIGPAPILAFLVGLFHTSLYTLVRGTTGGRLPVLLLVAWLGAWAGDGLGARIGLDLLRIGDFRLVAASLGAWLAIAIVAALAILGPSKTKVE